MLGTPELSQMHDWEECDCDKGCECYQEYILECPECGAEMEHALVRDVFVCERCGLEEEMKDSNACKTCGGTGRVQKSSPYIASTKKYPNGLHSIWYEDCPDCKQKEE